MAEKTTTKAKVDAKKADQKTKLAEKKTTTKAKVDAKKADQKTKLAEKKTTTKAKVDAKKADQKTKLAEKKASKKQFVAYREKDKKWAVTVEGGKKATKLFNTKAEAEEYAKTIAKNQDTKVVRKKMDGKFQKDRY